MHALTRPPPRPAPPPPPSPRRRSFLKLCASREELGRLPQGPKVVLATLPSLEAGPARALLAEWGADPRSAVVFTQEPEVGTIL